MAYNAAEELPRHNSSGLRRMDNLETSRSGSPKYIFGWVGLHNDGAFSKIRRHHDLVRAWFVLLIITATTAGFATAVAVIYLGGT